MSLRPEQSLEREIAALEALERTACVARWTSAFGCAPPKHLSVQFIRRVLIWKLQMRILGGVSSNTERALERITSDKVPRAVAKPGVHLVREWNGRTYQVAVTEAGYGMDGRTWRFLSALARHITGAHWSGPRFFGLR